MDLDSVELDYSKIYLNKDMKEELYNALAKKEAYRLIRKKNTLDTSRILETHIKSKFVDIIGGS